MWKNLKRKSPFEQKKSSSLRNSLYLFAHASGGAGAIMLIGLFLTGAIFVGVAIDYDRWRTGKQQMDSALRRANIAAGTACRIMLEEGKSADRVETEVQEVFDKTFRSSEPGFIGGVRVREGTRPALKVEIITAPTPPTPTPSPTPSPTPTPTPTSTRATGGMKCSVESSYEGEISTTLTRLVGMNKYYFKGYAKGSARPASSASSTITTAKGGPATIDFLLDVSGSMSTVAESDQRSMMAAVLLDTTTSTSLSTSCVYVCHSPFSLLGHQNSTRIINVMEGKSQPVKLAWDPTFQLNPPTHPGPMPKRILRPVDGKTYIQLGEALAYMGIKVKSDILAESMGIAIDELSKSSGSAQTDVAFHRFSNTGQAGGFKTVVPTSGSYTNIHSVTKNLATLKEYFSYLVQCGNTSGYMIGSAFARDNGTVASEMEMKAEMGSKFCEDGDPDSFISSNGPLSGAFIGDYKVSALWRIHEKLKALPDPVDPSNPPKRVIVLITDGVNTPRSHGSANKIDTRVCTELKKLPEHKRPILMIIHAYYRLQSGNGDIANLAGIVIDGASTGVAAESIRPTTGVTLATIEKQEKIFNAALAVPLKECAKELNGFYYSADSTAEIEKAFKDMVTAVTSTITTTTTTEGEDYIPG